MYKIKAIIRHSETDNWDNGANPDTSKTSFDYCQETFTTPADVVAWIKDYTRVTDNDAFSFDACEELGRIDVQFNSTTRGGRPLTEAQAEAFKAGADTYSITVSFYVEQRLNPETATWGARPSAVTSSKLS